ncbi:MAG TPA: alpha/beta fold hydrolase [Anaerolineales bacterium]|nr:alpha/beta fold hydrolase [Anaerolineales bacterium]
MRPSTTKLFLALLLLTACARPSGAPAPTSLASTAAIAPLPPTTAPTATPTHQAPPVPPTTLPQPSAAQPVTITAPDGAALAALYYPPIVKPAPAVLLLHMLGGSKSDWDSFAKDLQKQGYAVVALDLRGHGQSAGPADWAKAPDDVRAAWKALIKNPDVDPDRAGIVGASIGANLALMVGATEPQAKTVVALSPGMEYHGLSPAASMSSFGERPVYLVASSEDTYPYTSIDSLAKLAIGAVKLQLANAGHGTAMFKDATLETKLIEWLNEDVRDAKKG